MSEKVDFILVRMGEAKIGDTFPQLGTVSAIEFCREDQSRIHLFGDKNWCVPKDEVMPCMP